MTQPLVRYGQHPGDAGNNPTTLNIEGVGRVQVSSDFRNLTPAQQQQAVAEIRSHFGPAQGAGPAQGDPNAIVSTPHSANPLAGWAQTGLNGFRGIAQGAGHVMDNAAELLEGGYNQTLGRVFGESHSAEAANNGGIANLVDPGHHPGGVEGLANQLGEGNGLGRTLGEIGMSTILTRRLPGGAFGQGAGAGLVMSDADTAGGRALDTVAGGVGGYLTDRLFRVGAAALAPEVSPAARRLHDRGIHITPGQAVDRIRRFEERRTSRPFVGDQIVLGRQQGYRDLNRVALEDTAGPVNRVEQARGGPQIQVPQNLGNDAVRHVGDEISRRYERLVPRLSLRPDADLATDIGTIAANTRNGNLSPTALRQFNTILRNQVTPHLNGANPIAGPAFRQIEQRLGNQVRRFGNSTDPDHQAMAEAFGEMQQAFQRGLQRSNPAHAAELGGLNEAWANLVRVEDAAGRSAGGLFSANQFRQAVRRGDNSTRHRGMARGEARMFQLADDAADVLPNEYPDSGTAGRQQANPFDPRSYLGLAQSRFYTPEAQSAITNFLMRPRGQATQTVADALRLVPAPQTGAAAAEAIRRSIFGPIP